jgi:hypothetical protein
MVSGLDVRQTGCEVCRRFAGQRQSQVGRQAMYLFFNSEDDTGRRFVSVPALTAAGFRG